MNALRHRRWTRLAVLLLHVLMMGIASASPWLQGDDGVFGVRCGAARAGGLGAEGDADRSLDCPLCLPLQAPPAHATPLPAPSHRGEAVPGERAIPGSACAVVLPPARAPPRV